MDLYQTNGLRTLRKVYNKDIDKDPVTSDTVIDFAIQNVAKFLGIEKPFHNSRVYRGEYIHDQRRCDDMIYMLPHIRVILDHAKKYIEIHTRKPKNLLSKYSNDFREYFKAAVFGTPYSELTSDHLRFDRELIVALLVQLVHQMALLGLVRVEGTFVQVSTQTELLYYALSDSMGKHNAKDIAREFSSRYKLGGSRRSRSHSRSRRSRSRRRSRRSSRHSSSRRSSRRRSRRSYCRSHRRSRRRSRFRRRR